MGGPCCSPEYCAGWELNYSCRMVIARFNRPLAIGFFLMLIVVAMSVVVIVAHMVRADGPRALLEGGNAPAWLVLVSVFFSAWMIASIFRRSRAIWIENGALHFYSGFFDEIFFAVYSEEVVPLDAIAGLSSVKAEFPGAVKRRGIYVDLKSGKSHKIATFLLTEKCQVVMARLSAALAQSGL